MPGMTQSLFHTVDIALNAWDHIRENGDLFGIDRWTLQDFIGHVFVGWDIKVVLRDQNAAAVVVGKGGWLLALPLYWPEEWSNQRSEADHAEDGDEDDAAVSPTWREVSFDTALTDSVSGSDPMDLVELLIENESDGNAPSMRLATALAVEAVILSAPADRQQALRVLLALQGLSQHTGYTRVV